MLSIVAKNTNPDREEDFLRIIRETLSKLVKEGINRQTLSAGINSEEFKHREADFGRFPKGLMYGLNLMDTWLYDENRPFDMLELNETFKTLKERIDTGYFEELVEKYLLNNAHSSFVILKPGVSLTTIKGKGVADKLAAYKATLSDEEITGIIEETKHLKEYQSEPTPDEDLEKIPLLSREDISRDIVPLYNSIEEIDGVTVDNHDIYTNGIGYLNICFNIKNIADEDIQYVALLGNVFGYIDTLDHPYDELSNEVDINTGGIFPDFNVYQDYNDKTEYSAMFQVKAKALTEKFDVVFALVKEMMFRAKYDDYKRLKEILAEVKSRLQSKILSAGHVTSMNECLGQISEVHHYTSLTSGIAYYWFISDLYENFETRKNTITEKLNSIVEKLFVKDRLIISFTAESREYETVKPYMTEFIKGLPVGGIAPEVRHFELKNVKTGYKTASQVNYVARCGDFEKYGCKYDASLKVLKTMLSYDYLWNNIRVKGGAYGCMNGYGVSGTGYFLSYRDPNCEATNKVYEGIPEYVKNFTATEREMTKYIIGTISEMDIPLTPSAKGTRSFDSYMRGVGEDVYREHRNKVLDTTPEDINALSPIIEAILKDNYLCVIGNGDKIEQDKDMFDEIKTI